MRLRLRRLLSRFESIHADRAAELALASSEMTTPFPRAIFVAYIICAGLTGFTKRHANIEAGPGADDKNGWHLEHKRHPRPRRERRKPAKLYAIREVRITKYISYFNSLR